LLKGHLHSSESLPFCLLFKDNTF